MRAHLAEWIREWSPDLVHLVSGYLMGTAPLEAAQELGIPTVVTLTDFWFLCPTIQLVRGDGSLCAGPEPLECWRCLADSRKSIRRIDRRYPDLVRAFWRSAAAHPILGDRLGLGTRLERLAARRDLLDTLGRSNRIFSLTQAMEDRYTANGLASSRVVVKPDCLDLEEFDAVELTPAHAGQIRFAYFGQITPIKGVDVLVRAFSQLKKHCPRGSRLSASLSIHGNLNSEPGYARRLIEHASASPNITFHGPYEHRRVLQLMNGYDIVVVPSLWYENSPRVILEAFAAGRPVIGTRVDGITEIVQEGVNGILFARGSAADLQRAMERVLTEPELLAGFRSHLPPIRTLDMDMQEIVAVYQELTARGKERTAAPPMARGL